MKENTNIKLIFKGIGVFLFYYFYSYIFIFLLWITKLDLSKLDNIYKLLILSVMDLLLVITLWYIYRKSLKSEFIIFKSNWKNLISSNIKYWIIGLLIMSASNILIGLITSNDMANNEELVRSMIYKFPIYGFFSAGLVAPFVEEIVFRKTFVDVIKNKYILMITCGVAFGLIHVVGTYEKPTDLLYILPYGIFGTIFAYIYYKTKTIFTSMSLHILHNNILLLLYIVTSLISR